MAGELQIRVGQNLRAYRNRRGLSQEAFAYQLDVHRSYVGGVERGDRNITLRSLERIAEQLGVDPSELVQPIPGGQVDAPGAGDDDATGWAGADSPAEVEAENQYWPRESWSAEFPDWGDDFPGTGG